MAAERNTTGERLNGTTIGSTNKTVSWISPFMLWTLVGLIESETTAKNFTKEDNQFAILGRELD